MKNFFKKIGDYIKKSFKNFCDREYKYYSDKYDARYNHK